MSISDVKAKKRSEASMKQLTVAILGLLAATSAFAQTANFDTEKPGSFPQEWTAGVTGKGHPKWVVELDPTAPSKPNVLKQSGEGTFPWCVKKDVSIADGFVEVKFKSISGQEDQAGGLIWRWKDSDNYYVARANALENNISLYHVEGGSRKTIKYVDAPVSLNRWHTLRVDFSQTQIKVSLDDKPYIDLSDNHISSPGAVGVWTKADSVTAFDDFNYGNQGGKP